MALKKVKLNYMSATTHTEPKAKIKVSSAKMEELDRSIKEKTSKIILILISDERI